MGHLRPRPSLRWVPELCYFSKGSEAQRNRDSPAQRLPHPHPSASVSHLHRTWRGGWRKRAQGEAQGWREPGPAEGSGEGWEGEARGSWRACVRHPASSRWLGLPWGRDCWGGHGPPGLQLEGRSALCPLLTFGPSKSSEGSRRQGGDLGPGEATSRCERGAPGQSPLPLPGGWLGLFAFSKGPCAPRDGQACPQPGNWTGCGLRFAGRGTGSA